VILCFSDTHYPANHPDTYRFLEAVANKYKPTRVMQLGDLIDGHSLSNHDHNPDMPSPGEEVERTISLLQYLYGLFPKVDCLWGNHCLLFERRALKYGLPRCALRDLKDIIKAPSGWQWHNDLRINVDKDKQIYFTHYRSSGLMALAQWEGCSALQGHYHHLHQLSYWRNSSGNVLWNGFCGALVDDQHMAMLYAKNILKRSSLGCTVIVNGNPILIPLILRSNHRWRGKI